LPPFAFILHSSLNFPFISPLLFLFQISPFFCSPFRSFPPTGGGGVPMYTPVLRYCYSF
jgi:hypothetical protein